MEDIRIMQFDNAKMSNIAGHNTIRLGTKWADLQLGEVIEGVSSPPDAERVFLTVSGISVMHLDDAIKRFAETNHGVVDMFATAGRSKGQRVMAGQPAVHQSYLKSLLYQIYDLTDMDFATAVTVVEFAPEEAR